MPRHVPIPGLDQVGCITSDEALDLRHQPESMLVLGGGAVAVELAQFFARIGTRVTLIQRSHQILSESDEDLARPVEENFRQEGIEVYTGTQLHRFSRQGELNTAHFSHADQEKTAGAQVILQALGRRPNIDGLGLEAAGVESAHGRIMVDAEMRTIEPGPFEAFTMSLEQNYEWSGLIFQALWGLLTRDVSPTQLVGPVGIAQLSGDAAQIGWVTLFGLMSMISLNLGILNLLPIPILDGGHIFIMAMEGVSRRDFSMRLKERIALVGFVLLMTLIVMVTYNDLARFSWIERLMIWR